MKKHNFLKLSAATALTLTGVAAVNNTKPVNASTFKILKRIKINYLSGYGIKIWTNYQGGTYSGMRAHDGTTWNVIRSMVDRKGRLWYQLGPSQWVEARYTVDLPAKKAKSHRSKKITRAKKIVNITKRKIKKSKRTKAKKTAPVTPAVKPKKNKTSVKPKVKKAKKTKTVVKKEHKAKVKKTHKSASKVNTIVSLAKKQIGQNYVWAGIGNLNQFTGKRSFDCSGLVCYVYKAVGINLPRTTYDQVKVGKTVNMNALKAGDLLFWGSKTMPYHVAIYIGNGQYVNAATPDQGVVLQNISSYFYPSIAKRVLP
jgi:cell wall-associated NlpC family hydrolase